MNVRVTRAPFAVAPIAAILMVMAFAATMTARAQDFDASNYPSRPIRIIVPFPAGGPTDLLSRIIGKEMTASWGQPVMIENRPGADTDDRRGRGREVRS